MTTNVDRTREMAAVISFANHIIVDWDDAMGRFFEVVHRKMNARNLTAEQVAEALDAGYGDAVAEGWREWAEVS